MVKGSSASREEAHRQWRRLQSRLLQAAPLVEAYPWLRHGRDVGALGDDPLSRWEAAVIATYQMSADSPAGTLRLHCPQALAGRLATLTAT